MNVQQLQEEVLRQAASHQDAIFLHLIEREEAKLRDVPKNMTLENWVDITLGKYTQAKLKAHRIRRLLYSGCGSSVSPDPDVLYDEWEVKLKQAEAEVEEARSAYYQAVGKRQKHSKK